VHSRNARHPTTSGSSSSNGSSNLLVVAAAIAALRSGSGSTDSLQQGTGLLCALHKRTGSCRRADGTCWAISWRGLGHIVVQRWHHSLRPLCFGSHLCCQLMLLSGQWLFQREPCLQFALFVLMCWVCVGRCRYATPPSLPRAAGIWVAVMCGSNVGSCCRFSRDGTSGLGCCRLRPGGVPLCSPAAPFLFV
jgi:hypothetical protein